MFSSVLAPPLNFLTAASHPGFCHSLSSSLILLASVHVCVFLFPCKPLPGPCLLSYFCPPRASFQRFPLPSQPPLTPCTCLGSWLCLSPGLCVSSTLLIATNPAGLTTLPARGRLHCYTCSFAKPCYPVPTECGDDEACGVSIGTSGRTLVQWPSPRWFPTPLVLPSLLSLADHRPPRPRPQASASQHRPFLPQSRVRSSSGKAASPGPSALCLAMPPTGHAPTRCGTTAATRTCATRPPGPCSPPCSSPPASSAEAPSSSSLLRLWPSTQTPSPSPRPWGHLPDI